MLGEVNFKYTVTTDKETSQICVQRIWRNAFPGVEQSIKSLENYLLTYYLPDTVKFNEIIADFIEDIHGNMVFLQIKAFEILY